MNAKVRFLGALNISLRKYNEGNLSYRSRCLDVCLYYHEVRVRLYLARSHKVVGQLFQGFCLIIIETRMYCGDCGFGVDIKGTLGPFSHCKTFDPRNIKAQQSQLVGRKVVAGLWWS